EIPMIFVGNKTDLNDRRVVNKEDVAEWVFCDLPKLRTKVMECSSKNDINVREVFKAFLQLAKIPMPNDDCGLRRRSSAHSSVPRTRPNTLSPHTAANAPEPPMSPSSSLGQRLKPRSRSLIRRTSKKVNKVKDPNAEPDDCFIS
ncbi:Ras-related protein RabO-like protein, partial [Dinothrombium tinctorium]